MSNDANLLAELGLAGDTAPAVTTETAAETVASETAAVVDGTAAPAAARAPRVEIKINATTSGVGLLPPRVAFGGGNTGPRGSKYPFADLTAPAVDEAGNVTGYSFFTVKLADTENSDEKKLQAAVQAAVAAQNKQNKDNGSSIKYVSRTVLDEKGAYEGSSVYRVDATLGEDE